MWLINFAKLCYFPVQQTQILKQLDTCLLTLKLSVILNSALSTL